MIFKSIEKSSIRSQQKSKPAKMSTSKREHGCQYADPGCPNNWCGGCEDEEKERQNAKDKLVGAELAKPEDDRVFSMTDIQNLNVQCDKEGSNRLLLRLMRKHFGVLKK